MASSNKADFNLDLTDIESDDFDQLATRIETFYKNDSSIKTQLSYNWERNHLMLDGKQWLAKTGTAQTGRMWAELQVSKANDYIPRPVTNYLFDAYQTLKAYLIQHNPRSTVRPNTQTYEDKMRAKLAELVAECSWERLKESNNYGYAAACGCIYGTVFKKSYWDTTALTIAKIPKVAQQPITDPTTGAMLGYEEKPVIDPMSGEPVMEELPLGDTNTEVVEPYRITLDPLAQDLTNPRWVMESSIQPISWIKEMYSKEEPGYTGLAEEVQPETSLSNAMRKFYDLKTSSGIKGYGGINVNNAHGETSMIENAAVVKEVYERPSKKYPKGRMVVVAANKTVYSGDSPYSGTELGDWHPYSEFRWEIVPGRFWGKSFFDDAVELQKRANSIDATVILTRKTVAIPQKILPKGCAVPKGQWTGRPGQEIEYREIGGPKPETVPAAGVDAQVWEERRQVVEDMKQLTGAIDILKGDRPPGVTAASALEMLFEVGTGKLRPALDRWKNFIESDQKKQLKLVAKMYKEPREDFIRLLQARNKTLPKEMIDNFIGMDLYDNCNLTVEAGSNIPKLQSAAKAQLMQVAQTGALQLDKPENRAKFLEDMGITGYDLDVSPDVKRAEYENDILDNIANSPGKKPIILLVDKHEVHMEVLSRRMKEPSWMDLPSLAQQSYLEHYEGHQMKFEEQQQQAAMQAMAMGQPPMPPENSMAPQKMKSAGKGVSQDMADKLSGADAMPKGPV